MSAFARMRSGIPGIAWPPVVTGEAAALAAALRQYEDSQWLTGDEIAARQFEQLVILADHCERFSPQFRGRLRQAGLTVDDLATMEGLRRLPLLRRRDVQGAPDLFCVEIPADHAPLHEARTSGSTGEPVSVRRSVVSNFDWGVFTLRENIWYRRDFSKPFCAVRGHLKGPSHSPNWGAPTALLFETGPSLGLPITMPVPEQIAHIAALGPETLLTYPSNLVRLIEHCAAHGNAMPILREVRAIGETVPPGLREATRDVLGAIITDNYSSQEIGAIACQCPDAPLYHVMETVLVEVLDENGAPCAAGETGRVVVSDLRNFATPLIRYDIGDYAEAGPSCPCGRGLPTLTRILGRERNLITLKDGRRHWPLMGADYFRIRDIAPVRQYQLIQQESDLMEIRLVSDARLDPAQEEAVRAMVEKIFLYPFRVRFVYFDGEIPKGANGKFEIFFSRVP